MPFFFPNADSEPTYPYGNYETIDDTNYPLAHGQLLGNFANYLDDDIIFQLGEGNIDSAIAEIKSRHQDHYADEILGRLNPILERLQEVGAWDALDVYEPSPEDYPAATEAFKALGLNDEAVQWLATGHNRFDLVSSDFDNPTRQKAAEIWDNFADSGYWDLDEI